MPALRRGPTHGELPVEVRKVEGQENMLEFIASTDGAVRDGSILKQNWELRNFRKNPLFLWGHDYSALPVGKVKSVKVQRGDGGKQLHARVQFVPGELYPFAEQVRQFYESGYLHAVSVGFQPTQMRDLTEKEREEFGVSNPWAQVFEKAELLEISAVTVPMDANALKASIQRGFVQDEQVAERVAQAETKAYGADQEEILAALDAIQLEIGEDEPEFGAGVDDGPIATTTFESRLARATTRLEQASGVLARTVSRISDMLDSLEEQLAPREEDDTEQPAEEFSAAGEDGADSEVDQDTSTDEPGSTPPAEPGEEEAGEEADDEEESGAIEDALADIESALADLTTVGKE